METFEKCQFEKKNKKAGHTCIMGYSLFLGKYSGDGCIEF